MWKYTIILLLGLGLISQAAFAGGIFRRRVVRVQAPVRVQQKVVVQKRHIVEQPFVVRKVVEFDVDYLNDPTGYYPSSLAKIYALQQQLQEQQNLNAQNKSADDTPNIAVPEDVSVVFQSRCAKCHTGNAAEDNGLDISQASLLGWKARFDILRRVEGGKALEQAGMQRMPIGQPPLSPEEIDVIRAWAYEEVDK